ncbi:WecB/TagA/CpsF family glycosyltransferase [Shinella granuli]|uniref:N-acetylglucosaminyldiphosphoundecaprenol N-acetyl-beta-D-mannosaminyltransferase n=1 Tax=Shinella granuli TaxID=323621 RepID=A0A4R2CI19_SHIGR|nr:WecB/TagA/CpsF family glycosyltransferase [Shinella granuli]TCN39925.1 N-acetylglucosaminyldiphosphoundecaprenol N-acetyl-beta-D-mannosaminyltransferase [Shinella granuli]
MHEPPKPRQFPILGIPVSVVDLKRSADLVSRWARGRGAKTVFVREVASLMAAVDEPYLAALHQKADLVVPDGVPLVWTGRLRGVGSELGRVPGADLLDAVCQHSLSTGQSHYFFGGKPGVADEMAKRLAERHRGLAIAGTLSPPFRTIGPDFRMEGEALVELERIRQADPDFIWVGISSPKQEYWMMQAAEHLPRGVLIGVGAAFDFHSGAVRRAPRWMRNNGLEWAHRLSSEPRRLWRRYLVLAPRFVLAVALESIRRKS